MLTTQRTREGMSELDRLRAPARPVDDNVHGPQKGGAGRHRSAALISTTSFERPVSASAPAMTRIFLASLVPA